MNPYQKGAKLLLRVMALGMIIVGGMNVALELLRQRAHPGAFSLPQIVLGSIGFLAGVILFAASAKIAARWTQDFDE
jgi:O-antigen/teichoic acid export membrane protein